MPSIITRGGGSARGFGFAGAAPLELQTVYFYSSQTWVAPAGVSLLSSVTLVGGTGDAAYTSYSYNNSLDVVTWNEEIVDPDSWFGYGYNQTTGDAQLALSFANGTGTGVRTAEFFRFAAYPKDASNIYYRGTSSIFVPYVTGEVRQGSGPWDNTTSALYQGPGYTVLYDTATPIPATTGGTTSAFGYSAAGGTGTTGSTTNASNVSVTPGSSYGITVGADSGYVRVQYFA